ncbi:MAG TPA: helix-turn-helix domain-containing protein [Thermohalobaculum sp.]|nr:helix-turn-helix domain-containing protein [Thermohalobaculum sp.]
MRRAIAIFELLLAEGEPMPIAKIIARLGIPKSTAYELVHTLSHAGYLERSDRSSSLFLGRKLFELGMAYRAHTESFARRRFDR